MRGGEHSGGSGPGTRAVRGSLQSTGDLIVMSRLLVLQSRRILLASLAKRLEASKNPRLRARAEALEASCDKAHNDYRKAVLAWSSPESAQFWLVSYQSMIEGAEELAVRLRSASEELPNPDRARMNADIIEVDQIIKRWRNRVVLPGGGLEGKEIAG